MTILFLDIDGVCNRYSTKERFDGFIGIDPELAQKVRDIIDATNCKVVLSSTWRLDEKSREHVRQEVCDFVDVTPSFGGGLSIKDRVRGREISRWLSEHPEVDRYAILDDDGDFFPWQPLFQTLYATGLTTSIKKKVIEYLNASTNIRYRNNRDI